MASGYEQELTEKVVATVEGCANPRLRQVVGSLVRHVHAFVRDVEPTEDEWAVATKFLADTGRMCSDQRQEFNLLSDILGVTMLVDAINHQAPDGTSESSVLGPFYRAGAATMPTGASISQDGAGDPLIVSGRVTSVAGQPIAGALLDVWQTAANGLYENQDDNQPDMNLRGRFATGRDGHYEFRSVLPVSYPIPSDGPVGQLLRALGRHPYRPAHTHFIITAEGYVPLTTQLFMRGDKYLDSDAVFGVKQSLIVDAARHDSAEEARKRNLSRPFYTVSYDFALKKAA